MMDVVERNERNAALGAKIKRRIRANRIVALIRFRDHFSSSGGKNSWSLCGYPMYYWPIRAAYRSSYLEKILVWTEVESAREVLAPFSDRVILMERTVEQCREPTWRTVDDLKRPDSRVDVSTNAEPYNVLHGKIRDALDFEPTIIVRFSADYPLTRAETFDRVVERYFGDDVAEECRAMTVAPQYLWQHHPEHPEWLVRTGFSNHANRRQVMPFIYTPASPYIITYPWCGMKRVAYVLVPFSEAVDVHTKDDLELAEFYMRKRLGGG